MVETKTIEEDRGKRCTHCGKDLYRCTVTWWMARHGEYCSRACGERGAHDLEAQLQAMAILDRQISQVKSRGV